MNNYFLYLLARLIGTGKVHKVGVKLLDLSKKAISSVSPDSLTIKQVKFHANRLLEIDKLKKHIIKSIISLAEKLPEYDNLCSIPGISTVTAVSLIAELGEIRRFNRTSQI